MEWFIAATGIFLGGLGADITSTYTVRHVCPTCYERNPIMAPLLNRPALFAVAISINSGIVMGSTAWLKPRTKWWWVVPVGLGIGHGILAVGNFRLMRGRR